MFAWLPTARKNTGDFNNIAPHTITVACTNIHITPTAIIPGASRRELKSIRMPIVAIIT